MVFAGVGLFDVRVEPHVCHGHAVLCQRPSLVGTDRRRRTERLHGLEVLHQAVLTGHPLGRQRQTHLQTDRQTDRHTQYQRNARLISKAINSVSVYVIRSQDDSERHSDITISSLLVNKHRTAANDISTQRTNQHNASFLLLD